MKYEADRRGAELVPSSLTLGIESGKGVVSMRTSRLNLFQNVSWGFTLGMLWRLLGGRSGKKGEL